MKFKNKFSKYNSILLLMLMLFALTIDNTAQNTKFTLVIDAGHGGHDPGAIGAISREKDINLAVSLQLGALVEKNFKDVNVVFTRKTDKYLTLQERADVVNNNHADLFICIHTNSAKSSLAFGSETFTLGLAKSKANLDVAMRENSVILLEDDYKTKYKGFDPASVESYIMFEFMQDKYIDKSIDLASTIQKQFSNFARRSDRGVRQAGFWVLHRSACPSVLVELGFISNPSEEQFLTSESGQKDMATAIYNAFVNFKRNHDKKSGKQTGNQNYVEIIDRSTENLSAIPVDSETETIQPETAIETKTTTGVKATDSASISNTIVTAFNNTDVKPVFKVQLFACRVKLKPNASDFKGLKEVDYFVENDMYKYTIGVETEYNKIAKIRKEIIGKFPDAFIIAFVGDKKITAKEALKLTK
jgi:N-acetylmuramoyl-L-alanine amidase